MKTASRITFGMLPILVSGFPSYNETFEQKCALLGDYLNIPRGQVVVSEFVPAGTVVEFPDSEPTCNRTSQAVTVDLCRVGMNIDTSERSGIYMESWLPKAWTGRFLSTGNGGLGGCIQYEDVEYAASLGFAAVGTNNGHDGMSGIYYLHNEDVLEDYVYRALHTGVVVGKQVTKTFYRRPHTKSYYLGCSSGGRQGLKEAQDFPDDFDGIVAGDPAINFNNLTSWSCHFLPLTGVAGSPTFVPLDLWSVVHEDILAQCDELDGVADGVIENPDLCNYNPDGLVCAEGQTSDCLTSTQVETVRGIYSPLLGEDGKFSYPRMPPGTEGTEAPAAYYGGTPFDESDWFRYVVFNDSNWDPISLVPPNYTAAHVQNPFNVETWNGDLSPLKNKGAKLLHYHGSVDGIISSDVSPLYYEHVSETMNLSTEEMDDFYRFFRIAGMGHCSEGPGASFIGNIKKNTASLDPDENVLMAMVRWVEEDIAPETITGTAFVNGTQSAGLAFKRAHCKYPLSNVYQSGDPSIESSWSCV